MIYCLRIFFCFKPGAQLFVGLCTVEHESSRFIPEEFPFQGFPVKFRFSFFRLVFCVPEKN